MAVSIYNNLMSLNSQRHLGVTNSYLGKSLERLSSGLRINHAADDASGLAISEKLRGQISGLKRAVMNAQDGISMLQTAEGALEEVSTMLQRMRELSIQAANGIYTTNDRVEIQKEVEQLKAEINRISTSTEFNTKKLLNGDGTALWSASSDKVSAIIRSEVAEGNYEISLSTTPGTNEVYKTDIMTLQEGKIGAEITTAGGTQNTTNVTYVKDPISMPTTGTAYFTVTVGSTTTNADVAQLNGTYQQIGSSWSLDPITVTTPASLTASGYYEIEFLNNVTAAATTDIDAGDYRYRFINASTGNIGSWVTTTGNNIQGIQITSGATLVITANLTISDGQKITAGDKMLIAVSDLSTIANETATSGGGTIQLSDGPTGYTGPAIEYGVDTLTKVDNGDGTVDYNDVTVYYAQLDQATGNMNLGNITLEFKEQVDNGDAGTTRGATDTGSFQLDIRGGGEAATTTTKLKDISRFVDADGVNVFENKQELTIWGNGKSATIFLEGDDTVADLETKIINAVSEQLGMGSASTQVNSHLVDYISVPDAKGLGTVKGTFILQTAMTGEQGMLAFSGDQALIDALSLARIQEAENNTTTVTVKDAHTGKLIGIDETGNDRVNGIIDGIELILDSRAGIDSSWDATNNVIKFSENTAASDNSYFLHVVNNSTELQIGPNQGQTLSVSIPQLDVAGLDIENVKMVSQELAQKAIPDIDNAIAQVVTIRATIGAQINRLDHTISSLNVAKENMTASESRIRDLDVAEEMATFTRYQILGQSGMAMLAQANQIPQMALQLLK